MIKKPTYDALEQRVQVLEKEVRVFRQDQVSRNDAERIARNNRTMLRISMALPQYPDLEDLLDYISSEIKRRLDTQGALVILLDEIRETFFFLGAAYDDTATKKRTKEICFPIDDLASGHVIKSGKPVIVNDTSGDSDLYPERDKKFGYHFKNYILVPLKSSDRIIGVLAALNKTRGDFEQIDVELLDTLAGIVALSVENARFSEELKKAYRELTSLDRAKSKAINHLSHELKTPVSIFSGTLAILEKKLAQLPEGTWKRTMDRAQRNLDRIKTLQGEVNDIIQEKRFKTQDLLSFMVDQCSDLIETIIADEAGETPVIERVRNRIKSVFEVKEEELETICMDTYITERLGVLTPLFAHRPVEISTDLDSIPPVYMPVAPLQKVVDGLIKNAIENTPDHGKIKINAQKQGQGLVLAVKDYGVGITKDHQQRIFEGFFTTQDTASYSSKKPFDFNAGGRGADLLRMKIFSERYNFKIHIHSSRCRFISGSKGGCPGDINACPFCKAPKDCHDSGGSSFSLTFPAK